MARWARRAVELMVAHYIESEYIKECEWAGVPYFGNGWNEQYKAEKIEENLSRLGLILLDASQIEQEDNPGRYYLLRCVDSSERLWMIFDADNWQWVKQEGA